MNETTKSYGQFDALIDIIAAPGKAIEGIKGNTKWLWTPLLIIIVMSVETLINVLSLVEGDAADALTRLRLVTPSARVIKDASNRLPGMVTRLAEGPQARALCQAVIDSMARDA